MNTQENPLSLSLSLLCGCLHKSHTQTAMCAGARVLYKYVRLDIIAGNLYLCGILFIFENLGLIIPARINALRIYNPQMFVYVCAFQSTTKLLGIPTRWIWLWLPYMTKLNKCDCKLQSAQLWNTLWHVIIKEFCSVLIISEHACWKSREIHLFGTCDMTYFVTWCELKRDVSAKFVRNDSEAQCLFSV